ncbi:MAG TPA: hypothetical protein VF433_03885 [Cellvibrio sp.]
MDEIDRLNCLWQVIGISRKSLLEKLGIDYNRFGQVMARKQALRAKELIQIAAEFPEYEYWILTGKELPIVKQSNPMSPEAIERRKDERFKKDRKKALESFRKSGMLSEREKKELELLTETKFSYEEIRDALWEMEHENDKGIWPPASEEQDEKMKSGRKRALEEERKIRALSKYEEEELKLLTENNFRYDEIQDRIIAMKSEDRKTKYSL